MWWCAAVALDPGASDVALHAVSPQAVWASTMRDSSRARIREPDFMYGKVVKPSLGWAEGGVKRPSFDRRSPGREYSPHSRDHAVQSGRAVLPSNLCRGAFHAEQAVSDQ
jgi:hypothetical protein